MELEGEIASDLSALHRVDDMWSMGSRRWALLVPRLYAYTGAVQARAKVLAAEIQQAKSEVQSSAPPAAHNEGAGGVGGAAPLLPGPPSPMQGGKEVEATPAALRFSDVGDMFSFGTG